MKLELAKDLFRDSWNRRDQLTAGIATPLTVLTGVGGAVAVLGASFSPDSAWRSVVFAVAVGAAILALIAAAFFLAHSYHGYTYEEIPNAVDLNRHCAALQQYHESIGNSRDAADADFDEYLSECFVEAADVNSRNNVSKAAYLYRASQSLLVAIVAAAVAAVPWAVGKVGATRDPQRVTVESPVRVQLQPGDPRADQFSSPTRALKTDTAARANPDSAARGPTKPADQGRRTAAPKTRATTPRPSP
jgi:hypothetical protein